MINIRKKKEEEEVKKKSYIAQDLIKFHVQDINIT